MNAMAKAAPVIIAALCLLTGCGSSEPDFSQYTEAQVREYCRLQFRVVQRAPITVFSETEAFERYVACIRKGKQLSERY